MSVVLIRRNLASDLSGGADFDRKLLSASDTAASKTVTVAAGASEESYAYSDAGVPGSAAWATGTWTLKAKVTTASAAIYLSTQIDRIDSAGAVLQSSTASAEQQLSSTGVKTFTHAAAAWTSASATDRFRIRYIFRNAAAVPRQVVIEENTTDCTVDFPVDPGSPSTVSEFFRSSTASDLSGGADFSRSLAEAVAASATIAVTVAASATETSYAFSPAGVPGSASWQTGTWTIKVEVTVASVAIFLSTIIDRIDEDGNVIQSSSATAEQQLSATGVKTFVHTGLSWSAGSASDRFRVRYIFRNNVAFQRQVTISENTADASVDTPLTTDAPPPIYYPLTDWENKIYASSQCGSHPIHTARFFRSSAATPESGLRPWAAFCTNGGTTTSLHSTITTAQTIQYAILQSGRDLFEFTAPVPRGGATTNNTSDATFNAAAGLFGDAYRGNGVWYPEDAPNLTSGSHPFFDPTAFTAPKGVAMFTQWVSLQLATLDLDPDDNAACGRSMGAMSFMTTVWAKDQSSMWLVKVDPQDSVNTQGFWKRALADLFPGAWWPVIAEAGPISGVIFPVDGGEYDEPAATMGETPLLFRQLMSALSYAIHEDVLEQNERLPVYIYTAESTVAGAPYTTANTDAETWPHSVWHARAMGLAFPQGSRNVARGSALYDASVDDDTFETVEEVVADQMLFLDGVYDYALGEYETLHNTIRSKFATDVEDALAVSVSYDNLPFTAPDDAIYIRFRVTVTEAQQIGLGLRNTHRKAGVASATICAPLAGGQQPALAIADSIFAAFAGVTEDDIRYGNPRVRQAASEEDGGGASWNYLVEIPFNADYTPATQPTATSGAAATCEDVSNAIRSAFDTLVASHNSVPVFYDNGPPGNIQEPQWVRLSVIHGDPQSVTLGSKRRVRSAGIATAQIFVPVLGGDQPALQLADLVNEAFRAVHVGGADFLTPAVKTVGADGTHWQVNVSMPFTFDRFIVSA